MPRRSGVFVTGTDTSVGKTAVSAALLHRYRGQLRYWKPVQTGIEQDDDTAEVQRLSGCGPRGVLAEGVRLRHPVSPHLAARLGGVNITIDALAATLEVQPSTDRFVVEGAGGVLVPLNDTERMVDLIARLGLPAVVVSRSSLGTINHTLLTLEALRARAVPIAGVVMVGPPNADNRLAIDQYGHSPVLGALPLFEPLTPERLRRWAEAECDPESRLLEYLR